MARTAGDGVVVGMDAWPGAQAAVEAAADEADRRGAPLHVLHAFPWLAEARHWDFEPPEEDLAEAAREAAAASEHARARRAGLEVTTEVVVLDAAAALVQASRGAGVVVVGAGGDAPRPGAPGRAAQDVVAHAACPVLVVRDAPAAPDGPVVVGMDPDDGSPEAMEYAFADARRRGSSLTVVQGLQSEGLRRVWENLDVQARRDQVVARTEERAREVLRTWQERFPDVDARLEQVRDDPVDALVAAAGTASVVVVGSRGHGGLLGRLLGSVSRGVIRRAPLVAVVRVER